MSRFVTVVTQNVTPGPVLIDPVSRLHSSYQRHPSLGANLLNFKNLSPLSLKNMRPRSKIEGWRKVCDVSVLRFSYCEMRGAIRRNPDIILMRTLSLWVYAPLKVTLSCCFWILPDSAHHNILENPTSQQLYIHFKNVEWTNIHHCQMNL